jgi:hypothetical protein
MPGARCTRGPCAKCSKHTVVTTVAPEHPAFPHAMVLTAYAILSPATNSSCHRHRRISGIARPGWARITFADLAPATGARTTRFCRPQRPSPIRARPCAADRISAKALKRRSSTRRSIAHRHSLNRKPALQSPRATTLPRPPHPIPTSVTIAIRPSLGTGWGGINR